MYNATRFVEINLQTHQLAALIDFYRDSVGSTVAAADASSFMLQIGASRVRFTTTDGGEPAYHFAFNIPDNKIEQALRWLEPRAQLIPHFQTGEMIIEWPAWSAHSIYFFDPAGNIVELIARHGLDNGSTGAFGSSDLLGVSELGLVVPDPQATIDLLSRTFDLPRKSVLPGFGAVGDDHGLFIISAIDRPWMPTADVPARPFPARAVVRHADRVEIAIPGTDYYIVGTGPNGNG
jgi:catechol-2,3-dioxygenase